MQKDNATKTA